MLHLTQSAAFIKNYLDNNVDACNLKRAVEDSPKGKGGRGIFSIGLKREVIEFTQAHNISTYSMSSFLGFKYPTTLYEWKKQYDEGLFDSIYNAVAVSHKLEEVEPMQDKSVDSFQLMRKISELKGTIADKKDEVSKLEAELEALKIKLIEQL